MSHRNEWPKVKPATEDLAQRRPVWEALADLFLDTDPAPARSWRISVLAASPYTLDELQQILVDEIYPVCRSNDLSPAGEWSGFDPQWLETNILRRLRSPWHRWRRFSLGRLTVLGSSEWRQTKEGISRQRAHGQSTELN